MSEHRVIEIHPEAPPKPAWGQPCNGCGVCCLAEPCPLGVLVSRRRQGACRALQWVPAQSAYRCGLMQAPAQYLPVPGRWAEALLARLARRWIAAGIGCDAAIELPEPEAEAASDAERQAPSAGGSGRPSR